MTEKPSEMKQWIPLIVCLTLTASGLAKSPLKKAESATSDNDDVSLLIKMLEALRKHPSSDHTGNDHYRATGQQKSLEVKDGVPCTGVAEFTSATGTSTSDGYPSVNYADYSDCGYRITAPPGNIIEVTFTEFVLELSDGCTYDSVTLYDGSAADDPLIDTYCGTHPSIVAQSTGTSFFVKFTSDLSENFKGFSFNWRFVTQEIKPSTACGDNKPELLEKEEGEFSSHQGFNDQQHYLDNSDCAWRVVVPSTMRAHLHFLSFSLEPGEGEVCDYDKVLIYDGSDATGILLGTYCGDMNPGDVTASGNVIYVEFKSDPTTVAAGFRVQYSGKDKVTPSGGGEGSFSCGVPSIEPKFARIVGGQPAIPHSWPWQVSIRIGEYGWMHWCGGSIISPTWVITAAHCIHGRNSVDNFKVMVGDHNKDDDSDASQVLVELSEIILHESYDPVASDNDIALFRLKNPVVYNSEVSPVCLPSSDVPARTLCVTTGWGETEGTADNTYLQQVQVPILDRATCNQQDWYDGRITPTMLCAGYSEGRKDSCQGDSGGPLVCTTGGPWKLHGLTSWGFGCAEAKNPGLYAKVTMFLDWIQSKTGISPA